MCASFLNTFGDIHACRRTRWLIRLQGGERGWQNVFIFLPPPLKITQGSSCALPNIWSHVGAWVGSREISACGLKCLCVSGGTPLHFSRLCTARRQTALSRSHVSSHWHDHVQHIDLKAYLFCLGRRIFFLWLLPLICLILFLMLHGVLKCLKVVFVFSSIRCISYNKPILQKLQRERDKAQRTNERSVSPS